MIEINSFILGNLIGILFTTLMLYIIYTEILDNLKKNMRDKK